MGRWDGFYARLPVAGQHLAVTAYGLYWRRLRFGPGFEEALARFRARDHWSAEDWRALEANELRALLSRAAAEVPYYRETWGERERKGAAAGLLQELPLLSKEPIRANPEAFLRDSLRGRRLLRFHTSGSTGTPIASLWTPEEFRASLALREARSAGWAGVSFRQRRATFSGASSSQIRRAVARFTGTTRSSAKSTSRRSTSGRTRRPVTSRRFEGTASSG